MVSRREVTIGILNLGFGNIQSLRSLLDRLGYYFVDVKSSDILIERITHLIIPGAGDYASASEALKNSGMISKVQEFFAAKKPLMGICLGMQIMTSIGFESSLSKGLDLFKGETKKMDVDEHHRLPHVGWNAVSFLKNHPIFEGIKNNVDFYFTHSYIVKNIEGAGVLGETTYYMKFPSIIGRNNVIGTQFHPEKSLKNGMRMIDNFCQWDGAC